MDDVMQQRQHAQMQRTMKDLNSIEKKASGSFSEAQRAQMEQQYMTAMQQGSARMQFFGIRHSDFGKMENVSARAMHAYYEERKEVRHVHQIEERGKQKRSKQERAVNAQMGEPALQRMAENAERSAQQAWNSYEEKKSLRIKAQDTELSGLEFQSVSNHADINEQEQAEMISELLLKRDAIAEQIKDMRTWTTTDLAEREYYTRLLEKINDATETWLAAGGVSTQQKRVSSGDQRAARKHLALALEDYKYYAQNKDSIIGGMLIEQIKKTEEYRKEYQEVRDRDLESSRSSIGVDHPIAGIYKDDIVNLRNIIASGGARYEQNKKLIKKVYEEYMQHSVAFSNLNLEVNASTLAAPDLGAFKYLEKWRDTHDYQSRQHELAMDAAAAYIKFLIQDKQPDPTLAVYIEQHWGEQAFAPMLDTKVEAAYADPQTYQARIDQRIREIRESPDWTEEEKNSASRSLNSWRYQNEQAVDLVSKSDYGHLYQRFNRLCKLEVNEQSGTGYRDVSRVMFPLNATDLTVVDPKYVQSVKKALYHFKEGVYIEDQKDEQGNVIAPKNAPCTKKDRLAGIDDIRTEMRKAYDDIRGYVAAHEEQFQPRTLQQAFQEVDVMAAIYQKAQGLRDMGGLMIRSTAFDSVPRAMRKEFLEIRTYAAAVTAMTKDRNQILSGCYGKTIREMCSDEDVYSMTRTLAMSLDDYVKENR